MMLCKLLASERLTLTSVKKHWGAGFEMIYFDGKQFAKLNSITYLINQGIFNEVGDIPEVPVPGVILHYKYYGEALIITVIRTHKGTTQSTDTSYIITCKEFATMQFVVLPIGYTDTHKSQAFRADPSFLSNRTAMAYINETANGHYLPASFNIGNELEIKYEHQKCVTITMMKGINHILVNEAKRSFQILNRKTKILGDVRFLIRSPFCPLINTNLYLEKSCGGLSLAFCKNQFFQV